MKAAAAASGKEDINDIDLKKDMRAAGARMFRESMDNCSAEANDDSAELAACKEKAEQMMNKFLGDDNPKKSEIRDLMKRAGRDAAAKAKEKCMAENMTEDACETKIKEALAAQGDKKASDMTKLDVKTAIGEAARDKAGDEIAACLAAKQGNKDAACPNFYDGYVKMKGGPKKSGVAGKIDKERVNMKLASESAAASKRLCFSEKNKKDMSACLDRVKTQNDKMTELVFADKNQDKISNKKKIADREASVSALGSAFEDCMNEATNASQKADCKSDFEVAKEALGINWNSKAVLKSHQGKRVAEAASSCKQSEGKSCRQEIKKALARGGMEEREYRGVKLLGAVKTAAETWAACTESSESEAECDAQAKQAYLLISGGEDAAFSAKVKTKVRKLAQALIDGTSTEVRSLKAADVAVTTDETECSSATPETLKKKVEEEAGKASSDFGQVSLSSCVLVDGEVENSVRIFAADSMTDLAIDAGASSIGQKLDGSVLRRLGSDASRRLAQTKEVFAAQSQEECSVNDAQCGQSDSMVGSSSSGAMGQTKVQACSIAAVFTTVCYALMSMA
jgi:hypothetical protein